VKPDYELTKKEFVEACKPHFIGALINMVTTAVSTERNAATASKNRGAQMAAAQMNRKGMDFQPTALTLEAQKKPDDQQMSLGDLSSTQDQPKLFKGDELGKGFDYSPEASAPQPGSQDSDFHSQPDFQAESNPTPGQGAGSGNTNNYAQYANAASGILGSLMQRPQPGQAQIPQPGQMNFSPTALAILARRKNPYGGY